MKHLLYPFSSLLGILLLSSGCTTTSTVEEPGRDDSPSDIISFTLNAPAIASRADASHTLRYTARLFKKNSKSGEFEFLQKKQILEGSSSSILIFEGVEQGDYAIYLFADYLPSSTQPLDDGTYPDCYYDTSLPEEVALKKTGPEMINNDNYDCFAKYVTLTKGEEEAHSVITLTRVVAKVRVADNDGSASPQPSAISLTRFPAFTSYKIKSANPANPYNYPNSNVSEGKWEIPLPAAGEDHLFYFYTFAPSGRTEQLSYLSFSVEADGLSPVNTQIQSGKIEVRQNYVTTLRGDFVPHPEEDPGTRTDRILLDLSALADWNAD